MDSKLKTTNEVRFDMKDLLPIGIGLVVFAVAIGFGLQITGDVKSDFGTNACERRTDAYTVFNESSELCGNGTTMKAAEVPPNGAASTTGASDSITAVAKFPDKLGILVTVVLAAIVIGVLLKFMVFNRSE